MLFPLHAGTMCHIQLVSLSPVAEIKYTHKTNLTEHVAPCFQLRETKAEREKRAGLGIRTTYVCSSAYSGKVLKPVLENFV